LPGMVQLERSQTGAAQLLRVPLTLCFKVMPVVKTISAFRREDHAIAGLSMGRESDGRS
jgi:hypothetical protein